MNRNKIVELLINEHTFELGCEVLNELNYDDKLKVIADTLIDNILLKGTTIHPLRNKYNIAMYGTIGSTVMLKYINLDFSGSIENIKRCQIQNVKMWKGTSLTYDIVRSFIEKNSRQELVDWIMLKCKTLNYGR